MKKQFKLGNLNFSILGESNVNPYVQDELSSAQSSNSETSRLEIEWVSKLSEFAEATVLPPYKIGTDRYEVRDGGFIYQVCGSTDNLKVEIVCYDSRSGLAQLQPRWLRKFRNWNYLNREEEVAKNFMYSFFDYIVQCCQTGVGQTFLHASSITKGDRGVVIAGWGGVGKTTSVLKLVTEQGWKFLSDDLGLIDEEGHIHRHPKKMQIYAYNLLGQPALKNALLSDRAMIDRLSWKFKRMTKGTKGVRRRVSAEELFGCESVGKSNKITDVFLIERADCSQIELGEISLEEAVSRCAATLIYELNPAFKVTCASRTAGLTELLPSISQLESEAAAIIASAFSNVTPRLIRIPIGMGPNELSDRLIQELSD